MAETEATVAPLIELKSHCSACGSTAPHHLAYVRETGKCVT